jgi:hypothetical protein
MQRVVLVAYATLSTATTGKRFRDSRRSVLPAAVAHRRDLVAAALWRLRESKDSCSAVAAARLWKPAAAGRRALLPQFCPPVIARCEARLRSYGGVATRAI